MKYVQFYRYPGIYGTPEPVGAVKNLWLNVRRWLGKGYRRCSK